MAVHGRYVVTAHNDDGGAYRYLAETLEDAENQVDIFREMNLVNVAHRRVLMDDNGRIV